ncbi:hypothetical protein [Candidatus Magnetaquicoccus inordinatus]|uniref:5'-methylthioadenosine/S-adenosylhomocysteine nucleosidase family protein n=1 Tax=Candidatus Magnetaquicoccus inordinatus TaxID=2496818 RepID=UPI00102B0DCA|nr:hypothetical protein [Candidatus Magnetaquicoccus inordinatus]
MMLPNATPLDVLILTALEEEMERVKSHMNNPQNIMVLHQNWWQSTLAVENDSLKIGLFCFQDMGNPQAAAKSVAFQKETQAELVVLIGLLGGREGSIALPIEEKRMRGDVVVAEVLVNYECGKNHPDRFESRSTPLRCDERLLLAVKKRTSSNEWTAKMKMKRPDGTSHRILPMVHFGTVASGEKVVADETTLNKLTELVDGMEAVPPLLGVEMEGYGTAIGSYEADVRFLFVKGICDWADSKKADDGWRPYAVDAAAALVFDLLAAGAFIPRRFSEASVQPAAKHGSDSHAPHQPDTFSGRTKLELCRRLGENWEDVADSLDPSVPASDRRRFRPGNECQDLWTWLEIRGRLSELSDALRNAGREELAQLFDS